MQIAIPIYPAFTALDAIGPYEVLQRLPGAEVVFCAERAEVMRTERGCWGSRRTATLAEVTEPRHHRRPRRGRHPRRARPGRSLCELDRRRPRDDRLDDLGLHRVRCCSPRPGVLDGVDATTHWAARGELGELGANPVAERVVERGKVITAAGVSSGIDMALHLAGRIAGARSAQAIQLGIEYDPDPPHDTGSLEKAPQEHRRADRHGDGGRGRARRRTAFSRRGADSPPVSAGSDNSAATRRIFSGIQPTGRKHLGNYIGAIRQYVAGRISSRRRRGGRDLLHRRPARDHRRLRPAELRERVYDTTAIAARRRARSRSLHPLPPGRRPRAHRAHLAARRR